VSNDPRLKEKDLEELRKQLLRLAVKFHRILVEQHRDDPASRADLGRAYYDLATLARDIDSPTQAIELSRQAVAVYEQLLSEHPDEIAYRIQLAHSLIILGGSLDDNTQPREARAVHERALETAEGIHRTHPHNPELRRLYTLVSYNLTYLLRFKIGAQAEALRYGRKYIAYLKEQGESGSLEPWEAGQQARTLALFGQLLVESGANEEGRFWLGKAVQIVEPLTSPEPRVQGARVSVYASVGRAYKLLSDLPAAQEAFRKEIDIIQKLLDTHPGLTVYHSFLGSELNCLAEAQLQLGQRSEGLASLKKSLQIKESMVARHSEVPDYKANLGRALATFAMYCEDAALALQYQSRAESLLKELTERFPKVDQYQGSLADCYAVRATLYERANQLPQALKALDEAIAGKENLLRTSDVPQHRDALIILRLRRALNLGQMDGVTREEAELAKSTNARLLYEAACVFAWAAARRDPAGGSPSKEDCARRAVSLLQRTIAQGFHDAKQIKRDEELKAVRGRSDFKRLLVELEKKSP
jgi:tetratricopeptide (TPR) repeat protein